MHAPAFGIRKIGSMKPSGYRIPKSERCASGTTVQLSGRCAHGCRTALHPEALSIIAALESKGIRVVALAGGGSDGLAKLAVLGSLGLDKVAKESVVRINPGSHGGEGC